MLKLVFPLVVLLLFTACSDGDKLHSDPKLLFGSWRLSNVDQGKAEAGEDKLLKAAQENEAAKEGVVYSFFPDGNFTILQGEGAYTAGKWSWLEEGNLISLNDGKRKETWEVKSEEMLNKKMELIFVNIKSGEKQTFLIEGKVLRDFKEDPYHPENNAWRLKAQKPENKNQLVERLANYFKHVAYIMKASDERNENVVKFGFSQGPVKVYNVGIGVYDYDIVPESWKNTYYSPEEAKMAYDIYARYLETSRYDGAYTGEWVKDDCQILTGIYGDFKSGKLENKE